MAAEVLAHELMADIYATIIAGDSYPLMLYNYFLPILSDIQSGFIEIIIIMPLHLPLSIACEFGYIRKDI